MTGFIVLEVFIGLLVVVLGIGGVLLGLDRYRRSHPLSSARPTDEVMIDPITGKKQRVWMDPSTGERDYRDEPSS